MGVLNVTPDSFSDGGRYLDPAAAVDQALRLVEAGADVIDVGAESTRPGAKAVAVQEEWERLEPVLKRLGALGAKGLGARLSVDTRKPTLMRPAADLGVSFINDVSGVAPLDILTTLAEFQGLQYIAMHMIATPETMQHEPLRGSAAVRAVDAFFATASERLAAAGFAAERTWLDPGIGFGKSDSGNLRLMAELPRWTSRYNVAVGVSRKSLIGRTLDIPVPADRDAPSKMLELGLAFAGAKMIRTHEVTKLRRLLDLLVEGEGA